MFMQNHLCMPIRHFENFAVELIVCPNQGKNHKCHKRHSFSLEMAWMPLTHAYTHPYEPNRSSEQHFHPCILSYSISMDSKVFHSWCKSQKCLYMESTQRYVVSSYYQISHTKLNKRPENRQDVYLKFYELCALWYTKMAKILGYYWKRMDQLTLPGAACQFTF